MSRRPAPRVPRRVAIGTRLLAPLVGVTVLAADAGAQGRQPPRDIPGMQPSGPVINAGGFTIKVDDPTFAVPDDFEFKAVFEINAGDTARPNDQLTTIARFLNLHARHGIPAGRVHAAAVVHGSGWPALLSDSAYAARYGGKPNPSRALVEELVANGVQLVLCGQTAGARRIARDELLPGVKVAISAMTALNVFQGQGYRFNPW